MRVVPLNALCPWQVKFVPYFRFDTQWCLKPREFLGVSNQIEDIRITPRKTMSFYNELKNRDVSCCHSEDIKCWWASLKRSRASSNVMIGNCLMESLGSLRFQVAWCFLVLTDKA